MKHRINKKIKRCEKRFAALIRFAYSQNWKVTISSNGRLKITLKSGACIYTTSVDESKNPKW